MAELDELSNEELFNSAITDETPEVTEQVAEGEGIARDELGRFAPKAEETAKPEVEQAKPADLKEEAQIPSWRGRELRERAEAAERRAADIERRLLALQPKPEATAKPDFFENPDGALKAGVAEALTPLQQEIATIKEFYSRESAIAKHGEERVTEAFSALDQAAKSGDPQAIAVVQHVKQSMNPYGEIVNWYAGAEAQRNPQAHFQRQLAEALKDEKFKGELLSKLQPAPQEQPKPVFRVPPSLSRVASAAPASDEGGDLTNESLFAHATR